MEQMIIGKDCLPKFISITESMYEKHMDKNYKEIESIWNIRDKKYKKLFKLFSQIK